MAPFNPRVEEGARSAWVGQSTVMVQKVWADCGAQGRGKSLGREGQTPLRAGEALGAVAERRVEVGQRGLTRDAC